MGKSGRITWRHTISAVIAIGIGALPEVLYVVLFTYQGVDVWPMVRGILITIYAYALIVGWLLETQFLARLKRPTWLHVWLSHGLVAAAAVSFLIWLFDQRFAISSRSVEEFAADATMWIVLPALMTLLLTRWIYPYLHRGLWRIYADDAPCLARE